MAFEGTWMVFGYGGEDPSQIAFVSDADHAAYLVDGWIDGFEYASAPIDDADLILDLVPRYQLEQWCVSVGTGPRLREMTKDQLIFTYLRALGYTTVAAVFISNHTAFELSTLGGEEMEITGGGFQVGRPGVTTVTIGGTPCIDVEVADDGTINCTSPAKEEGEYDVVVTNDNGSYTFADGANYVVV